jgi:hypothetical protein
MIGMLHEIEAGRLRAGQEGFDLSMRLTRATL